jgi:hypothetical protein
VQFEGLKEPVLLFELQLTVPVGLDPETTATQKPEKLT